MPKKMLRKIEKFYRKKGKSPKRAKEIAYATANKMGQLENRNNPDYHPGKKPRRRAKQKK